MSAAIHDTPTRRGSMMMTTTTAAVKKEGGVNGGTAPPARKRHRVDINDMVEESIDAESMMTHMQPEIKNEPFEDIDNTEEYTEGGAAEEEEENTNGSSNGVPKIRLTPTAKLMPTPNADPKRKFVCPYENCTKSYGKSSHLRSHLTWHTGIKPFVCQEANCGKGFTRSDELNRHIRTHTGEKPFECVQCTKKFSRSDHLTKHLATHAKQMLNPSTKRAAEDKKEKKKNNTAVPDFADSMHFLGPFVDNMSQGGDTTATPQHQPIKIKLGKPHHSNEYQVVPARIATAETSEHSASESNNRLEDKADSSSSELNDDDAIMPEANAEPLYEEMMNANNIEDKFGVPAHLAQFIERPFRCDNCAKAFKRQDDLSRHLRTHTGEKPFACTFEDCDKRFVRSDHMKKHLKTHFKHPIAEELTAEVQQTARTSST